MSIDPLTETRRKATTHFLQAVVGLGFLLTGVLAILLWLDVIEFVDLRPNRIAIFNDPHTWQVFVLGGDVHLAWAGQLHSDQDEMAGEDEHHRLAGVIPGGCCWYRVGETGLSSGGT